MGTSDFKIAVLAKEKGNVAFRSQDYLTARALYTYALKIDSSMHTYPLNRSLANLKLERWGDAEADATRTLDLSPKNVKAFIRRAWARREMGQYSLAREDVQKFVEYGGNPKEADEELKAISDTESSTLPPTVVKSKEANEVLDLKCESPSSLNFVVQKSSTIPPGHGAHASHDFKRGDMILSERPLFSIRSDLPEIIKYDQIEAKVQKLSPSNLDRYLSLENSHSGCSCHLSLTTGIFGTNAYALDDDYSGICLQTSRFNHSCSANARNSFNKKTGEMRVYALCNIHAGEEIFVSYIMGRNVYGTIKRRRQAVLQARYHFTCACQSCSLTNEELAKSDARRIKLTKLWENIPRFSPTETRQRLNVIVEGVHLLKEEGYLADQDDFTNDAAAICAYHSDWVSAEYWAELTYQTRVEEFGEDSFRADEVRGYYLNPKSFDMAGYGPVHNLTDIRV